MWISKEKYESILRRMDWYEEDEKCLRDRMRDMDREMDKMAGVLRELGYERVQHVKETVYKKIVKSEKA